MSEQPDLDDETPVDPVSSYRLFKLGCAAVLAGSALAWWRSSAEDPLQLYIGLAILILGCLPGLQWARHGRPWFPCFEISMLTCVVFYAVPLLTQSDGIKNYSNSVTETSGLMVITYLASAVLAFNAVRTPRTAPYWASTKLLPDEIGRFLPAGLFINTTYILLNRFTDLIPYNFLGTLRAICFGLGIITAFIMAREWGRDRLTQNQKTLFVSCLLVQVLVLFSHLYLINGMSLLILAGIGYTTSRRRLPWLTIVICLPVIAILHNGKSKMREIYWGETATVKLPSASGLPAFFTQWIEFGLQKNEEGESTNLAGKLAERASLFQMICMSVDQVPSLRPHLLGESYVDIPAQVIPRFLWPDKPSSLLSNVRLAIYFNLVDPDNPMTTSIAFGIISESYVNLGFWGVIAIGSLTGFGFKHIVLRSVGTPLFSTLGIFMILLTAWSFQAEQVAATWLASLFQASVISIGVPLAWKKFFGDI
ncbi:MAG: hypothetical protein H7Y06_02605 [Opitutaceae bacterium]|nr:hypothetical protein [Opitutaceae bacterium]